MSGAWAAKSRSALQPISVTRNPRSPLCPHSATSRSALGSAPMFFYKARSPLRSAPPDFRPAPLTLRSRSAHAPLTLRSHALVQISIPPVGRLTSDHTCVYRCVPGAWSKLYSSDHPHGVVDRTSRLFHLPRSRRRLVYTRSRLLRYQDTREHLARTIRHLGNNNLFSEILISMHNSCTTLWIKKRTSPDGATRADIQKYP